MAHARRIDLVVQHVPCGPIGPASIPAEDQPGFRSADMFPTVTYGMCRAPGPVLLQVRRRHQALARLRLYAGRRYLAEAASPHCLIDHGAAR